MKKKLFPLLGLLVLTLSGCDIPSFGPEPSPKPEPTPEQDPEQDPEPEPEPEPEPVHEHTYSNEWSKDETYHWHQATCEHTELFIDKEEHHFGDWITTLEPTEYEVGSKHRFCDVCQFEEVEEIGKLNHTHKAGEPVIENRKDPTCTRDGSYDEVIYCYECNEEMSRVTHSISALGHNYHSETVDPTYESAGKIIYTCETCGDTYQEEGAPKLVHNYSTEWSIDDTKGTHYHACIDEGYETLRSGEASHIAGEWVTTKEATDFVNGKQTTHCTVCGKEMTKEIDSYEEYCRKNLLNFSYIKIDGWNRYGYVVTGVNNKNVERLIIPTYQIRSGVKVPVKAITTAAFSGMPNLKELIINASIYQIGESAFSNCSKLETIAFKYPNGGLYGYNQTEMNFNDSIISKNAFYNCVSLKKISIPSYFGTIAFGAFAGCSSLEEMELPIIGTSRTGTKTTKYFGRIFGTTEYEGSTAYRVNNYDEGKYYIYYLPSKLRKVTISGGELTEESFYMVPLVEELYLGEYITLIGEKCVSYCPNLKLINVSTKIDEVQDYAFSNNPLLETAIINGEIKTLRRYIFENCTLLKNVELSSSLTSIIGGIFSHCESLESVNLPSGLTSIGEFSFYYCTSLKSFEVGENISSIGMWSFAYCTSIESMIIPSNVHYVHGDAFCGCTSLKEVEFNEGLYQIGDEAFKGCDLSEVHLPESLEKLGSYVFGENTNLKTVYIGHQIHDRYGSEDRTPYSYLRFATESYVVSEDNTYYLSEDGVLYNKNKTQLYIYPQYKQGSSFAVPNTVSEIRGFVFYNNQYLENIYLPLSITRINSNSLKNCPNLTAITYEGTIEEWNSFRIDEGWHDGSPLTVIHCSDGDINL